MRMIRLIASILMLLFVVIGHSQGTTGSDAILGTWRAKEKVLMIEVYKVSNEYRAKIISFTDHHSNVPSDQRTDEHNPNKAMRNRKMIGMDVLTGLRYNSSAGNWEDGTIYDAASGKSYDASVSLSNGVLSVRAYQGISLLGKTLHFQR